MARRNTKTEIAKAVEEAFVPDYSGILDSIEKKYKLTSSMVDRFEHAVSSGLLQMDLVMGGGLVPGGMYTIAGAEQSAKSTTVTTTLGSTLCEDHPPGFIIYSDGEGSFDADYFNNQLQGRVNAAGLKGEELFGVKNAKGVYLVPPKVRYYAENRGELALKALNTILTRMPDVELLDGQWYYVYENTKENQAKLKGLYDKSLFTRYNKFYVLNTKGAIQGIMVVDSWPAMVTERADDEDKEDGLGAAARMYAERIPPIKGKLRRKGVILIGINQLREKPMAQGDPRYEPGGNALKFNSDVRIWNTSRAVPHAKGPEEEEDSLEVDGGTDRYRYVHFKGKKNKLAMPGLEGWGRIWISDANGKARGFCPVYDVYRYLLDTKQASGTMKKLNLHTTWGLEVEKISFMDLKALILLQGKELKAYAEELGIGSKAKGIREKCFAQIRDGSAREMYFSARVETPEEDDAEEDDEDEEYDD